jgi:hypothetical protein
MTWLNMRFQNTVSCIIDFCVIPGNCKGTIPGMAHDTDCNLSPCHPPGSVLFDRYPASWVAKNTGFPETTQVFRSNAWISPHGSAPCHLQSTPDAAICLLCFPLRSSIALRLKIGQEDVLCTLHSCFRTKSDLVVHQRKLQHSLTALSAVPAWKDPYPIILEG